MDELDEAKARERRAIWRMIVSGAVGAFVVILLIIEIDWAAKIGVCFVAWGCTFLMIFLGARGNPGWDQLSPELEGAGIYLVATGTLLTLQLPGGAWNLVLLVGVITIVGLWDSYRRAWMQRLKQRSSPKPKSVGRASSATQSSTSLSA